MAPQHPFSYGGLELRLHARDAGPSHPPVAPGEDPFVTLSPPAHGVRFYSASLMLGEKVMIPRVAVAFETNEYSSTPGVALPPGASFAHIEKVWSTAIRAAAQLTADSAEGIVRLERRALPPGLGVGEVPRTPPLVYCTKVHATFEPLCPACLGRLDVCRDERLLRACGLPSFATTLTRYLYCEVCARREDHPRVFYTESGREWETAVDGVRIKRRSELYRDLAPRIQSGAAGPPIVVEHACFACVHRATCYPLGRDVSEPLPAESLLFPLAYYGALYIPFEAAPLAFDEAAALLGGAPAASILGHRILTSGDVAPPGPRAEAQLDPATPQFFYEGDPTGLFALEVFFLKMGAFAGLARGVLALHETAGRPHLAITPDRVRGTLGAASSLVPARWSLALAIADLVTTAPLEDVAAPRETAPVVWSLPFPLPEAFLPEALSRSPVDQLFMRLVPRALRVETQGGASVVHLEGELVSEGYVESEHGRYDLVDVVLRAPGSGGERVVFHGAKSGTVAGGFLFTGESTPLEASVAAAIGDPKASASASAEVIIHHAHRAPADVWSLGLLLLRLLLVNDRQEGARVNRDVVKQVVRAATAAAAASKRAGAGTRTGTGAAPAAGRDMVEAIFAKAGLDAAPNAVLFREAERAARSAAIPQALWHDALLLGLRMMSNVRGFSVCERLDDYPAEDPALPLRRVVEEAELLVERARGNLIGSSGRNAAVMEVCADFLEDVRAAMSRSDDEPSSEPEVERTMVSPKRKKR